MQVVKLYPAIFKKAVKFWNEYELSSYIFTSGLSHLPSGG